MTNLETNKNRKTLTFSLIIGVIVLLLGVAIGVVIYREREMLKALQDLLPRRDLQERERERAKLDSNLLI